MNAAIPFSAQLINLFAAVILLLAFAMLAQRRLPALINLFALQGFCLCLATMVAAVNCFDTLPTMNGVAGVMGMPYSRFAEP